MGKLIHYTAKIKRNFKMGKQTPLRVPFILLFTVYQLLEKMYAITTLLKNSLLFSKKKKKTLKFH